MSTVEVRTEVTLNSSPYLFFTRTHTTFLTITTDILEFLSTVKKNMGEDE